MNISSFNCKMFYIFFFSFSLVWFSQTNLVGSIMCFQPHIKYTRNFRYSSICFLQNTQIAITTVVMNVWLLSFLLLLLHPFHAGLLLMHTVSLSFLLTFFSDFQLATFTNLFPYNLGKFSFFQRITSLLLLLSMFYALSLLTIFPPFYAV